MDLHVAQSLQCFTPINLDALNSKSAMLERLDNKYIIPADQLHPAIMAFSDLFDVLEIEGKRAFTYATRYFDDADNCAYYDHHQGRRKRCKTRVRCYVDAGFSYLEVKLKDIRGITIKKRLKVSNDLIALDARCMDFIESCQRDQYGEVLHRPLGQVIAMQYERITLVAKEGGERMTIDTSLGFSSETGRRDVASNMFIVETKSARGNGISDKILRDRHLHPTSRCSKYCIGMAALGAVRKSNNFLPALTKLSLRRSMTPVSDHPPRLQP